MMMQLQEQGCHNINLVTPEHVVPQILEALLLAVEHGLRLPFVYNTSAYDSLDSLRLMDGIVDIYVPDFKFWEPESAQWHAKAPDYPETARSAIKEMHRQVGPLVIDEHGIAVRGVLLRHLIMPGGEAGNPRDHELDRPRTRSRNLRQSNGAVPPCRSCGSRSLSGDQPMCQPERSPAGGRCVSVGGADPPRLRANGRPVVTEVQSFGAQSDCFGIAGGYEAPRSLTGIENSLCLVKKSDSENQNFIANLMPSCRMQGRRPVYRRPALPLRSNAY